LQSRFFGQSIPHHGRDRGSPGCCSAPELCSAAGSRHRHANWVIESPALAKLALKGPALPLQVAVSALAKNLYFRASAACKPARYTSGLMG
jgi:hypothetical protein